MATNRPYVIHQRFDTFFAALTGAACCDNCFIQITATCERHIGAHESDTLRAVLTAPVGTPVPNGDLLWSIHALQLILDGASLVVDTAHGQSRATMLSGRADALNGHLCAVMAEIGVRTRDGIMLVPGLGEDLAAASGAAHNLQGEWHAPLLASAGRALAAERRAVPMLRLALADGCHHLHYAGDDPTVVIDLWSFDMESGRPMPAVILAVLPRVELNPARVRVTLSPHREPSRAAARAIAAQVGLALCDETEAATTAFP
jgi:hypothetical protein